MGAFNIIFHQGTCLQCGNDQVFQIDLYFGLKDQIRYNLNDRYKLGSLTKLKGFDTNDFWGYGYTQCDDCTAEMHCAIKITKQKIMRTEIISVRNQWNAVTSSRVGSKFAVNSGDFIDLTKPEGHYEMLSPNQSVQIIYETNGRHEIVYKHGRSVCFDKSVTLTCLTNGCLRYEA